MVPPFLSRTEKFLKQHSNLKQSFIGFPPSLLNCSEFLKCFFKYTAYTKTEKNELEFYVRNTRPLCQFGQSLYFAIKSWWQVFNRSNIGMNLSSEGRRVILQKTPLCHRPGGAWLFTRFLTKSLPGQTKIHQVHPEFFTREANDF